jgi:hypothetical protein
LRFHAKNEVVNLEIGAELAAGEEPAMEFVRLGSGRKHDRQSGRDGCGDGARELLA